MVNANPFAPAQIDFQSLANLPQLYQQGQDYARQRGLRNALQGADMNDFGALVKMVAPYDPELAIKLSMEKSQQDQLTSYRNESLKPDSIREYEAMYGPMGQQPQAPSMAGGDVPLNAPPVPGATQPIQKDPRGPLYPAGKPTLTQFIQQKKQQPLTVADRKAIQSADEAVRSIDSANAVLDHAIAINEKAYSGPLASQRGYAASMLHPDASLPWAKSQQASGAATQDLENTITGNALAQLRAVFGGNPTEGERAILIQMQGAVNQAPEVRANIFKRAKELMAQRREFAKQQAEELRSGTYYQPGSAPATDVNLSPQQAAPTPTPVPTMNVTPDGDMTPTQAGMAPSAPKVSKGSPQEREMLQAANEAIKQGADPAAVAKRLMELGVEQ